MLNVETVAALTSFDMARLTSTTFSLILWFGNETTRSASSGLAKTTNPNPRDRFEFGSMIT